ncbi:MAG: nitroreductase family protein [Smithellaceae bacterium]|nr:nitroreductase family protein [Syntrophaceae bacterium]MDD4240483.1 nitroreductase family protein [Smithellaceae bacterium]NLX50738.1 nitroreductase family protein [Deltaproteobacteria bacterium]
MMTFSELLQKRRAIRDFEDKAVPWNVIEDILKDAALAPSASNNQPCRFVVVQCRKTIQALSDESKANLLRDAGEGRIQLNADYIAMLKNEAFNVFYNAPCVIYVTGAKAVRSLDVDAALAASYIMFSAAARGLGTCWVGLGAHIRDSQLLGELNLSAEQRIIAPIILGYPRSVPAPSERRTPQILRVIAEAR